MKMNRCLSKFYGVMIMLFMPPAFASETLEFSLFVTPLILGLLLSGLFVLRQLKLNTRLRESTLTLVCVGSIIQVLAIELATDYQRTLILIGSTIMWLSVYLSNRMYIMNQPRVANWIDKTIASATLLYALALALLPNVNGYVVWVVFGLIIVFVYALSVRAKLQQLPSQKRAEFITLSTLALYIVSGYFWLNANLANSLFSLVILLTFVVFLWGKLAESFVWRRQHEDTTKEPESLISSHFLDPITNLPNYQHAIRKLKLLNHQVMKDQYVAIVFKPVNFKEVNRVLGHQTSDILLLQLAYSLQKAVIERRQLVNFNDSNDAIRIARLQGLDFLMVIDTSHIKHSAYVEVEDNCRKLLEAVPTALSFKSFSLNFDLAFGIAVSEAQFSDIDLLVKYASDALLEAEQQGRQIVYFDYKKTIFAEQQLLNMEKLKLDIARDQLDWLLHPQVSMQDQQLIGIKIESEWRGLNGDVLSKREFREVAEFSGEIYPLTKIAIRKAFDLLYTMHNKGIRCNVAIELSSVELLQPDIIEYIKLVADNVGISSKFLMLDIDESLLMAASEQTKAFIDQLKKNDVSMAIDNFSGSYEALRYLRRTIVSQVKVDCSNLNEQGDSTDKVIINALINLIRKMELMLMATNIDTQDARDTYLSIGGNYGQGRVVQRRLPLEKFDGWFQDWLVKNPVE